MQHFLEKYEKYAAWFFFGLMILCLIPMSILGFYNHPLGDDFYYGSIVGKVWQETGNIFQVLATAFSETIKQYYTWQGTYSAMFLMHLIPNVWGDFFYKLYPTVLFLCFTGSTFYFTHTILCHVLKASKHLWILITSLLVLTFTQQVPLCGETFYWYNGSMYYTGFLACTFVFWGLLIKSLGKQSVWRTIVLSLLAIFLAGGNYVSLLPTMIILVLFILYYTYLVVLRKSPKGLTLISLCLIAFFLFGGFLISAAAPGNAVRQATATQLSPIRAVLKAIYQNSRYCLYWNGIWSLLFFIFVTPAYLRIIKKSTWKFRYPVLVCGLIFGIYCSSSCPPFYAQSNGGAARVFCLVYYLMILALAMIYFYVLGAIYRLLESKKTWKLATASPLKKMLLLQSSLAIVFLLLLLVRPWSESYVKPHAVTALQVLSNGEAAYYEKQYQARLAILEDDSILDVTFAPYDVPESLVNLLYLGDISTDASHDVNRNMATLYRKTSIRIE